MPQVRQRIISAGREMSDEETVGSLLGGDRELLHGEAMSSRGGRVPVLHAGQQSPLELFVTVHPRP